MQKLKFLQDILRRITTKHGQLAEFDDSRLDWTSCIKLTELHFSVNGINKIVKQIVFLLSTCGPFTYLVIMDVPSPQSPSNVTYTDIVGRITGHFQPTSSVMV